MLNSVVPLTHHRNHCLAILIVVGLLVADSVAQDKPEAEGPSAAIPVGDLKRKTPVSFEQEVLPIFKRNCLACHNETKAKASLVLETPADILKGSEDGPVVAAGKGGESLLLQVTAHAKKPFMPPKNNPVNALPLTPAETGLVKLWIDQGATGVVTSAVGPVQWQPLPPGLNEIDAVAITPDGQFAACGRANQIFIYHLPSGQLVTRLTDPALLKSGFADRPGVADRDLVQSLAFSPDGQRLASGGYRIVKLWRRQPDTARFILPIADLREGRAVASSPNGKWLAVGGVAGRIDLCDAVKGKVVRSFSGHTAAVNSLKFSPDGARLCSGSADKTIRIWNVGDGTSAGMIETPTEANGVTWVTRGTQLASAGNDTLIRIWNLPAWPDRQTNAPAATSGPAKELAGHTQPVTCLDTLSLDGREIVSGSRDATVRVWDVESGRQVRQLEQGGTVTAVAARRDGRRFAAAGLNKVVKLWNAENGQLVAELRGERHAQELVSAAERDLTFAKNELAYQKGVLDNARKQEQSETEAVKKATDAQAAAGKALAEKRAGAQPPREAKAEAAKALAAGAPAVQVAVQLKDLATKVATLAATAVQAARDRAAQAKDALEQATEARTAADKVLTELTQGARAAADQAVQARTAADVEKDNRSLTQARVAAEKTASDKAAAARVALDKAATARIAFDHLATIKAAADQVAADAIASAKAANEAKVAGEKIFAEATKQQKDREAQLKKAENLVTESEQALKKAEEAKLRADHALEDMQTALKRTEGTLKSAKAAIELSEAEQKKTETAFEAAKKVVAETEKPVRAVAFSSDNATVATAGDDHLVHTWSADNGRGFETFPGHSGVVFGLAFVAEGALASSGSDTNLIVRETQLAWSLERTIGTGDESSPLMDRVLALGFSPDGKWLATGGGVPSRSGELKLWQVADGTLLRELKDAHSDTVFGVSFTADQKYLASGAADKFVKVFDPANGKLVKSFEGHTHHVLGVSWKRDGRTLASCGADKVVKIWDFVSGEQRKTIDGFNKEATSVHFIGGSNELLVSSGDHQVRIVREDGTVIRNLSGGVDFLESAAVTPDGGTVIAGGVDSVLRVWNGGNGQLIESFGPPKSEDLVRLSSE